MSKRKSKAKAPSLLRHSLRRLDERHGLGIVAHADAVAQILEGRALLIEKQSCRVKVYDVEIDGEIIRVVYDRKRRQLITALPKENGDDR